ncbi:unnamed protein product [Blepharisma stoltei]|uniref:Uncharacterized protein n=1 Tax=Blepharisma stoltei TaxID=1481888 RepID=A0AAU9K672_9CILI|nr:unnamed protein product [Blepharisma stoltei]
MLGHISKSIDKIVEKTPKQALYGFAALGSFYVLRSGFRVLSSFYRHVIRRPLDFPSRYGKGSWALVTGGANGIGKAWSQELAKLGFNILIIDFDWEAANQAKETIELNYKVVVEMLILDLSDQDNIANVGKFIEENNLDISILVNNAGAHKMAPVKDMPNEDIMKLINTNVIAMTLLTRLLLPKLLERKQRSAIINMSSVSAHIGFPYSTVYAATKSYIRIFSASLREEIKEKIDVLVVSPEGVSTNMTKKPVGGDIVRPEDCVIGALKELGRRIETFGAPRHTWNGWKNSFFSDATRSERTERYLRKYFINK